MLLHKITDIILLKLQINGDKTCRVKYGEENLRGKSKCDIQGVSYRFASTRFWQ